MSSDITKSSNASSSSSSSSSSSDDYDTTIITSGHKWPFKVKLSLNQVPSWITAIIMGQIASVGLLLLDKKRKKK